MKKIKMRIIASWMFERNGPTPNNVANFCCEMHSWGYKPDDEIPVDEKFINYASKSECFTKFLRDKEYIEEKLEYEVVKGHKDSMIGKLCFYLVDLSTYIDVQCVVENGTAWTLFKINKKTGKITLSTNINGKMTGLQVNSKGKLLE